MADSDDVIYRVDDQDVIIFVNEAWDRFAIDNAGEHLTSSSILQRSLWDFICDSTTRTLYQQLLDESRNGRSIQFTLRCDSPSCKRQLSMDIHPGSNATVEFRTHTLSEESRQFVSSSKEPTSANEELVLQCGWCNQVFLCDSWVEMEAAINDLQLFHCDQLPSLTHGICETCRQNILKTLAHA